MSVESSDAGDGVFRLWGSIKIAYIDIKIPSTATQVDQYLPTQRKETNVYASRGTISCRQSYIDHVLIVVIWQHMLFTTILSRSVPTGIRS